MYETLDRMILWRIQVGKTKFITINAGEVKTESERIAELKGNRDAWRVVDRRLQALRKKGEIMFDSKLGWSIE